MESVAGQEEFSEAKNAAQDPKDKCICYCVIVMQSRVHCKYLSFCPYPLHLFVGLVKRRARALSAVAPSAATAAAWVRQACGPPPRAHPRVGGLIHPSALPPPTPNAQGVPSSVAPAPIPPTPIFCHTFPTPQLLFSPPAMCELPISLANATAAYGDVRDAPPPQSKRRASTGRWTSRRRGRKPAPNALCVAQVGTVTLRGVGSIA